jgi:hypothetical protein
VWQRADLRHREGVRRALVGGNFRESRLSRDERARNRATGSVLQVRSAFDGPVSSGDAVRAVGDAERARIEADRMWQALSLSTDFEAKAEQPRVVE